MTTLTFRAGGTISASLGVDDFRESLELELEAETTPLVGGTFTVRVSDDDVAVVKRQARQANYSLVSETED